MYGGFWDLWTLYHKCIFDGENKLIFVTDGVSELDIKTDVYSDWKEWAQTYDNSKHLPAIRTIGGDPLGGNTYAGDLYFLINGWKLVIDLSHTKVTGALFSDDYDTAYYTPILEAQYPATVSQLVQTVVIETTVPVISGTPQTIADAVRTELTPELSHLMTLQNGLTSGQATMLLEIYRLYGLDPARPLIVTNNSRTAGVEIAQTINTNTNQTTVTRNV